MGASWRWVFLGFALGWAACANGTSDALDEPQNSDNDNNSTNTNNNSDDNGDDTELECRSGSDCAPEEVCRRGVCVLPETTENNDNSDQENNNINNNINNNTNNNNDVNNNNINNINNSNNSSNDNSGNNSAPNNSAPNNSGGEDVGEDPAEEDAAEEDAGGQDVGEDADAAPDEPNPWAWESGLLGGEPPARGELLALPGGGEGPPVFTSNNPEIFEGAGLLYGNARPTVSRGGERYPLSGRFGVYLHHLNRAGRPLWATLLITNPNDDPVTVSVRGSGYNQTEVGGLGLGVSPDYRVSREWILDEPTTVIEGASIPSLRPLAGWQKQVNHNAEIDGRFEVVASAPVYVYVVVTETSDLNDAVQRVLVDAPGDYRISGDPPPPYGREAGIYAHDTWRGAWEVPLPAGPGRVSWVVNSATGAGFEQVQAFPALTHLEGSAREAVGMYGNVYDLTLTLRHDGRGAGVRRARVWFSSLSTGQASRYWDGLGLVNGEPVVLRHVPGDASTLLAEEDLRVGEVREVRLRAMVPGLASIPQAISVEVE